MYITELLKILLLSTRGTLKIPSSEIFETLQKKPHVFFTFLEPQHLLKKKQNYMSNTINQSNVNGREEENISVSGIFCSLILLDL